VIICCIWVFCVAYNSPWLYLATLKQGEESVECGFKLERDNWTYKASHFKHNSGSQVMFLGDFAAFYLIPMFLYVIIYTKIALTLTSNEMGERVKRTSTSPCTARRASSRSPSPTRCSELARTDMRLQIPITPASQSLPREFFVNGNRRSSQRNRNQVQFRARFLQLVCIYLPTTSFKSMRVS
jgi:hypothetical protein